MYNLAALCPAAVPLDWLDQRPVMGTLEDMQAQWEQLYDVVTALGGKYARPHTGPFICWQAISLIKDNVLVGNMNKVEKLGE